MAGEEAENSVRIALNVRGLGEVMAEAVDGHPDGPSRFLGGVEGPEAVFLLVPVQSLKLALDLAPDRFDYLRILEDVLKLVLGAQGGAHDLRIVRRQTAFLEPGVGFQCNLGAGNRVQDFLKPCLLAVKGVDPSGKVKGVDRFIRRI